MAYYSSDETKHLRKPDGKCFSLIKKMWERGSDPPELFLMRKNYTVDKISDGLLLKDPFAVKGITCVLIYMSIPYPKDFMTDRFFNNYCSAIKNTGNDVNYILLGRLIRLLQTNKDFGDWMISKGSSAEDNKIWEILYELTKSQSDEDIRKEIIRAIKEGTRQGATEGQYCIIPEKNLERLRKEAIWKLNETDLSRLEGLARDDVEDQSPQKYLERLERENKILKANSIERIAFLEQKTQAEQAQKDRNLEELARAQARLRELLNDANESLNTAAAGATVNVSELEEVQMDINTLAKQVRSLRIQHTTVQDSVLRLTEEVRALRESNISKNREIEDLKRELHAFITKSLENVQNSLLPIIQGGAASTSYPAIQLNQTLSSNVSTTPTPPPFDEMELPEGWEKKLDTQTNRFYYINRATKKTQWRPPQ